MLFSVFFVIAGDVFIPEQINLSLQSMCLVLLTLGVAAYITPWLMVAMAPVLVTVYFMKRVMAGSMHHFKRLENVSRSPLISLVDLTMQGLPSIVTYGQQKAFFKR